MSTLAMQWHVPRPRFLQNPLFDSLLLAGTALEALGHGSVDVVVGDPALIVVLIGANRDTARLGARDHLGLDLLGALGRAGAARLWEKCLDPRLVDKVEGGAEQGRQEKVEEDSCGGEKSPLVSTGPTNGTWERELTSAGPRYSSGAQRRTQGPSGRGPA